MELTQEQKDRIQLLIDKELSSLLDHKHRHKLIIDINSKPIGNIDDEKLQQKRQTTLEMHQKVYDMYTKDIELLENIKEKIL